MPFSYADSPCELSNDDGQPEYFLNYQALGGTWGECAQYFHSDNPVIVLSAKLAIFSLESVGPRTFLLQFYEAEETTPGIFVPGAQFGPEVSFTITDEQITHFWDWVEVPIPATRIIENDFFVSMRVDSPTDPDYCLGFDKIDTSSSMAWMTQARSSETPAWSNLNSFLYGASSYAYTMYMRLELSCLPSIVASMKPLVTTALLDATEYWDCITQYLPEEPDEHSQEIIGNISNCMSNAASLSNPVYSNGELTKAVGYMAELDRSLRLNCRLLSCDATCEGSVMLLSVNDVFYLDLPENPSTGYAWTLEADEGLLVIGDAFTPSDTTGMLVGSGGTHTWELKAKVPGIYTVKAVYSRPWNDSDVADTFEMTVKVG